MAGHIGSTNPQFLSSFILSPVVSFEWTNLLVLEPSYRFLGFWGKSYPSEKAKLKPLELPHFHIY